MGSVERVYNQQLEIQLQVKELNLDFKRKEKRLGKEYSYNKLRLDLNETNFRPEFIEFNFELNELLLIELESYELYKDIV